MSRLVELQNAAAHSAQNGTSGRIFWDEEIKNKLADAVYQLLLDPAKPKELENAAPLHLLQYVIPKILPPDLRRQIATISQVEWLPAALATRLREDKEQREEFCQSVDRELTDLRQKLAQKPAIDEGTKKTIIEDFLANTSANYLQGVVDQKNAQRQAAVQAKLFASLDELKTILVKDNETRTAAVIGVVNAVEKRLATAISTIPPRR